MNCQRFEEIVSELAREQMMEAEIYAQAFTHSDECIACLNRLREEEALTRGLHALANETKSAVAPVELELRLRQAFRTPRPLRPVASMRSHRRYWLSAAAAVLLIVCSVVAIRWRSKTLVPQVAIGTSKDYPLRPRTNESPAAKTLATERSGRNQVDHKHAERSRVARALRTQPDTPGMVPVNNTQREIATEFMPLGYLNSASLQDGGQIVRVELPRSTLASFGLPVNMDRYNEKVKADVVLGVDGLAHAIRFVQ